MWTQMVGKLRLALSAPQNHFWHSALYVTARRLTSGPMPFGHELAQVDFDFIDHQLRLETSSGGRRTIALPPRTVADFYTELIEGCTRWA